MATKAQQAALTAAQNNYSASKSNTSTSKKAYNTAYNNYNKAVNTAYKPSSKVTSYQNASDKALAAASAMGNFKYDSQYDDKITGLLNEAENMNFNMNYSLTDDPAYQAYRDQYVHNGQLAAQDAAGNAVAQTGGYGSTAATAASQQAYNESLTELNNIVPELYEQAYGREWNKFTNQRDTLQELANSYQALDQQKYDQALSTWTNNFNQYIAIAEEYQSKYEYLDAAERAEYENKLDGLYKILNTAQNQYQNDQNIQQAALSTYNGVVQDNANYDETVRSHKANEAAAAAQLAEQKRQFNASLNKSKSSGSSSSGNSKSSSTSSKQTINIPNGMYQQIGMNRSDTGRLNEINRLYEKGLINDAETEHLLNHFNLK